MNISRKRGREEENYFLFYGLTNENLHVILMITTKKGCVMMGSWYDEYKGLNLLNGEASFIYVKIV